MSGKKLETAVTIDLSRHMPLAVMGDIAKALQPGGAPPSGLSAEEQNAYDQLDDFYKHGLGYALEMANRPQTLYGIVDSPAGLASWILDHDARSAELIARVFDGKSEGLTRDDILDNITLYWVTNTAISSGKTLTATGMETCFGSKKASLFSQYSRADEIAVLVTQ